MPPTLGQRLKEAREQRGLTLPDVAHATRIPVVRLQDLEGDNYTSLGSLAYTKGHLRAYAELLGVDAKDRLDEMKAAPLGGRSNYRYLVESYGRLKPDREPESGTDSPTVRAKKSATMLAVVSAFSVLVVGGVLMGNAFMNEEQPERNVSELKAGELADPDAPAAGTVAQEGAEFELEGVTLEVEPQTEVRPAGGTFVAPKAVPVKEQAAPRGGRNSTIQVPKAVPVE